MGFHTKNDHFGVFWGDPYFWKPPYADMGDRWGIASIGSLCNLLSLRLSLRISATKHAALAGDHPLVDYHYHTGGVLHVQVDLPKLFPKAGVLWLCLKLTEEQRSCSFGSSGPPVCRNQPQPFPFPSNKAVCVVPCLAHLLKLNRFCHLHPLLYYMGVSLNGGTPKTPQNDHF